MPAPPSKSSLFPVGNLDGADAKAYFDDLYDYTVALLGASGSAADARTALGAAADSAVVKLSGAQTVAGVKTFSSSPIIPDATTAQQPVSKSQLDSAVSNTTRVTTRQTVLSGPVDSNGALALGGSTGSTTVTGSGTIVATAAYGSDVRGDIDRVASITDPSWTGLSTNGTMYLYLTIGTDGTATPGASATAPTYQRAGTYSTTSGDWTYNYAEHIGKLGNGSTATQVARVYVGEVSVSGGVVSTITWYALRGEYVGTSTSLATTTVRTLSHNIGTRPLDVKISLYVLSGEAGWSAGDEISAWPSYDNGGSEVWWGGGVTRTSVRMITGTVAFRIPNGGSSSFAVATMSNLAFRVYAKRGW
jgi:hypothetical protein